MAARRGGLSKARVILQLSMRGAIGSHMIKIPGNFGIYPTPWKCALVDVKAAATAIPGAKYMK